jgi:hypothetical protein
MSEIPSSNVNNMKPPVDTKVASSVASRIFTGRMIKKNVTRKEQRTKLHG